MINQWNLGVPYFQTNPNSGNIDSQLFEPRRNQAITAISNEHGQTIFHHLCNHKFQVPAAKVTCNTVVPCSWQNSTSNQIWDFKQSVMDTTNQYIHVLSIFADYGPNE
jgi:hypothetical protein